MTQFHFIAGLPRSGSTLLAAILRQNPAIHASMSSPVGGVFQAVAKAISGSNEAAMFLSDAQRQQLLRQVFTTCYADAPEVVFDTNRLWPSKMAVLASLFPDFKMICCVRRISWIVDSIERLIRANPHELSGIFGFEPSGTVYSRSNAICGSNGLVGFALDALREGYYGEHAERMILVEYEALAKHPRHTIAGLYDWLGIPRFAHDFDHVEQIPGAAEFDRKLGTPALHAVRSSVGWQDRQSVLPPELFRSFPAPFWRTEPNPVVPVVHCASDEPKKSEPAQPASSVEIERMMQNARDTLAQYEELTNA